MGKAVWHLARAEDASIKEHKKLNLVVNLEGIQKRPDVFPVEMCIFAYTRTRAARRACTEMYVRAPSLRHSKFAQV